MDSSTIYAQVSVRYSAAATDNNATHSNTVAKAFGYSEEELESIPKDSNLGLSCGNPLALATLREGETVLDFGSGAGFDVFLAAKRVGPTGIAIGIDMNKDMLAKARSICASSGNQNVEFVEASITDIPLPSASADCIISNCVVNLVPHTDKQLVFSEMHRLLRPGGRVAISDILARKPLPESIQQSMSLYVGCIAGAGEVADYQRYLEVAGFQDIVITNTGSDLNVYLEGANNECCGDSAGSQAAQAMKDDLKQANLNEWAGSFRIYAVKS
ncbi:hypothetical protein VHEMI09105 [[Torrubiella] hemipterigena]|uniref:Arsenite methyltransferase n=1 Tax=[Torrubiella] hemipterigena TaxID=1531966 RepID=A0A0A1TFG2_9HYPO|nr:hypothetical protein VHEMI09105 [[Torrubiella] hemipterigena]